MTLRNSNQAIDDGEVRRKFQQFGDVKSVRPVGDRHESVVSLLQVKMTDTHITASLVNVTLSFMTQG